ncbi:hypothetical protein RM555_17635 [Micromonospora sp. DSM 115977]|uniref:PEP-CTERM protein-sorting domain-containing protein n=1 Tax=Micromonospora reichwaldensis TaxID=3075516 RepID=A0ABU2WY06_9ACTN|nr:hypothetical protein [Micromonospora sp. DSM 115977]MDT0530818.1 hypothetical protein [Micromonospora sp. DSM 115977]
MQAAAMSLAAVLAAAAVVRARRRRAAGDTTARDLPALRDSAFADAGTGGMPVPGGAGSRDKQTASPAAAAR